jgi:hypothetical protein
MNYLPTLRLSFPGGVSNDYRLRQNQVEFLTGNGEWRPLDEDDLQLHRILHTEVAKWLLRESSNASRTGSTYYDAA